MYALEHKGYYQSLTTGLASGDFGAQQRLSTTAVEWRNLTRPPSRYPHQFPATTKRFRYTSPFSPNAVNAQRLSGYVQNTYLINERYTFNTYRRCIASTTGRLNELLVSPRAELSFKPRWERDWVFRAAAGLYGQPAFYREMRDPGQLNRNTVAQRAWHHIAAADYTSPLGQPFRCDRSLLQRHVPHGAYELDNVRVHPARTTPAPMLGHDFASTASLCIRCNRGHRYRFLRTAEDIAGDTYLGDDWQPRHTGGGLHPRPSDQRMIINDVSRLFTIRP